MSEETQVGTAMPHGNNLFGLNCHVKRDENGEIVYTLTLNQGVCQPQKTYLKSTKVNSDGAIICEGQIERFGGAEVAFVPSKIEVDHEKKQSCVTMNQEEVLENVREFFSMTNEEVIRRYDIRGPHKHLLVGMIILDAIYQHDQENDGCGTIEGVYMDPFGTIIYQSKKGECYRISSGLNPNGFTLSNESRGAEVDVSFDVADRSIYSLDDIEITDLEISRYNRNIEESTELLALIRGRLERVFGPKEQKHTLEEVQEGICDVPRDDVMRVLTDINGDMERRKENDGTDIGDN